MSVIHHQTTRFYRRQQALLKLALQRCRFGIQRAKRRFLIVRKRGSCKGKALPGHLQQTSGFGVKGERLSPLPHLLHALKKGIVEPDIIRQFRQLRGKLLIKRLNGRIGLRARHREKTLVTRASSWPLCSRASSVLAKSAGCGLFTIAAISARWRRTPSSKAGR
jgi:hypothetical protein